MKQRVQISQDRMNNIVMGRTRRSVSYGHALDSRRPQRRQRQWLSPAVGTGPAIQAFPAALLSWS